MSGNVQKAAGVTLAAIGCLAFVLPSGSAAAGNFKPCDDIDELAKKVKVSEMTCAQGHKTIIDAYQGQQGDFNCTKVGQRARCRDHEKIVKWRYP